MTYRGDIKRLATEFEEEDYKFQVDLLSQGYRLRILTAGRGSIDGYINVLHAYPGYRTSRGHISVNATIVDSLKRNNAEMHSKLLDMHRKTIEYQSNKSGYKPIHKSMYDYKVVREIVRNIKLDYFKSYPRKKELNLKDTIRTAKPSKLGRYSSAKSIQLNLDKGYTEDWWPYIQDEARVRAKMKCECCGVDFSNHNNVRFECEITNLGFKDCFPLYHVHHKDMVKTNNSPENLEALCLTCHSFHDSPGHLKFRHGMLKSKKPFLEYVSNTLHHRILNQMRRRQGIDITFDFDFETLQRKKKPIVNLDQKVENVISQQSGIIKKQDSLIQRLMSLIRGKAV